MSKRILLIANHFAGSGRGKTVALQAEHYLKQLNMSFQFYQTKYPGHARHLAPQLAALMDHDQDRLVVIGGDGTLHEAVTGLKEEGIDLPVGYLPAGTGNDFARTVGITNQPLLNLENILAAHSPYKVECIAYSDAQAARSGIGLNSLGLGFDGTVINLLEDDSQAKKWLAHWKMDQLIYLLGIARAFLKRSAFEAEVTIDGQKMTFQNLFLVGIMNHPYFGGGIKLNPLAAHNNHELGLMAITDITFPVLLHLLPKVLTNGAHIHSPHFTHLAGKHLEIRLLEPQYGQVDGELIEKGKHHLRFHLDTFLLWK